MRSGHNGGSSRCRKRLIELKARRLSKAASFGLTGTNLNKLHPMETLVSDDELLALLSGQNSSQMPAVAPSETGVTTFDFGKVKSKKEETKKAFPVLPDPNGEIKQMADAWLVAHAQKEAAEGSMETLAAQMKQRALPFHYTINAGLADPPNTVSVRGSEGEVLIQYKEAYAKLDSVDAIVGAIGKPLTAKYFEQRFEYSVKSELIPQNKIQEVIKKMNELSELIGVDGAVVVKPFFKPNEQFRLARYRELTTAQNLALERIGAKGLTTVAVTSAKGRKK